MSSPHDTPYTLVDQPGAGQPAYTGPGYLWAPSDTPVDPHDESYEKGDGSPATGPLAPNVIATPGPFSRSKT
jgi:hypothetical protein